MIATLHRLCAALGAVVTCAALLAAAPAGAAIPLPTGETRESAATESPRSVIALDSSVGTDEQVADRIRGIFGVLPGLSEVDVAVRNGVVTLEGTVEDADQATRAEDLASDVEGVVTVENAIARDTSLTRGFGLAGVADSARALIAMLPLAGAALLVFIAIMLLGYLIAGIGAIWHRLAPNSFLAGLIQTAIRAGFVILGLVVALDMLGAGALLGAVLGGAGVIGLALGFAMRDTVENYVASLMLSLRQPFRANDHVVIDEFEGRVIRLTSRATILMTLAGNHLRIPNSTVFKAVILNYTRNPQRRFDFALGVDADDDAAAARRLGIDALGALPFVLADPPPEGRIEEVGDSNVLIRFLGWIDQTQADWFKAQSRAIPAVKQALEQAGFALPEPIYRLRFDQRSEPLPLENVAETGRKPAAPAAARSNPSAEDEHDIAPSDEVARMVKAERAAGDGTEPDLLDSRRPVE